MGCGRIGFDGTTTQFVTDADAAIDTPIDAVPRLRFEAEDFNAMTMPTADAWVLMTDIPGYSGSGFMVAVPTGTLCGSPPQGMCPSLVYQFTIVDPGTYYFHVRMYAATTADDSTYWGVDG